jgi:hydroxylaminobenzene mutase
VNASERHGHRLLQAGAFLFLLALIAGLFVSRFAVPRLGLSVHLLGLMQGLFLLALGVIWPRLSLTPALSTAGCALAVYGCVAAWMANLLAAVWGAGNSMLPFAAGSARGSALQETLITVALRSAAISLIATIVLVLWGLRLFDGRRVGQ